MRMQIGEQRGCVLFPEAAGLKHRTKSLKISFLRVMTDQTQQDRKKAAFLYEGKYHTGYGIQAVLNEVWGVCKRIFMIRKSEDHAPGPLRAVPVAAGNGALAIVVFAVPGALEILENARIINLFLDAYLPVRRFSSISVLSASISAALWLALPIPTA